MNTRHRLWLIGVACLSVGIALTVSASGVSVARPGGPEPLTAAVHSGARPRMHASQTPVAARPADADDTAARRALLDRYCVSCHSEKRKIGDLSLEAVDVAHIDRHGELWERVVRKLQGGAMPPAGMPRPDKAAMAVFIRSIEQALDAGAKAQPNPGRPVAHRLNRVEYVNAIRDLLDLRIDGEALLPADDAGFGFDNIADVLSVSPGLLERYLIAAQKISRLAVGDPTLPLSVEQYNVPYLSLRQDERMSEDQPFGSRGGGIFEHTFPLDGEYIIKVRLQRNAISLGAALRGLHVRNLIDVRIDGSRVQAFTVGGAKPGETMNNGVGAGELERDGDKSLDVRLSIKAGPHTVGISFAKTDWEVEGIGPGQLPVGSYGHTAGKVDGTGDYGRVEAGLDHIEIVGPINGVAPAETPARRRLFVCYPTRTAEEKACATRIIRTLARRAFRRPVAETDVNALLPFYVEGRKDGAFDEGIRAAVKRVLVDPEFLVRIEHQPANAPAVYPISDIELASRLSFFLWSSIPDDQLLDAAARGQLRTPAVLQRQVRRMLADEKAGALVGNFFGQWLWFRNIATLRPDRFQFPTFDENLRQAFQTETRLFIESQLRDDRPIMELLTANYSFVNDRLARHYGLPNVLGGHFRRVTLPDNRRAGLLGQGSILTATAYANRTSPVVRGKWVLENLLNTPPPVPPPNVPPFPESDSTTTLSVRQRMEQHRKNPVCAACHARLDPLGFAFENFDGIGQWREYDGSSRVDASGAFPDGVPFNGPAEFRQGLILHKTAFIATATEKLLTYALGRGTEYYDMPTVRAIVRDAERQSDLTWSSLILGIVNSNAFQMRRRAES